VRLRYAYFVKCVGVVKDEQTGKVTEVHCTYDPLTRGGDVPDGRKVKVTIHWVSARHACPAQVRLIDTLFTKRNPNDVAEGEDFTAHLNPNSLEILTACMIEPSILKAAVGSRYQFERVGYFILDCLPQGDGPVFNRIVTLRDTWAKIESKL
jgi:glutaminyl-tRNA synthetase